jgi:hypothetical protein
MAIVGRWHLGITEEKGKNRGLQTCLIPVFSSVGNTKTALSKATSAWDGRMRERPRRRRQSSRGASRITLDSTADGLMGDGGSLFDHESRVRIDSARHGRQRQGMVELEPHGWVTDRGTVWWILCVVAPQCHRSARACADASPSPGGPPPDARQAKVLHTQRWYRRIEWSARARKRRGA